MVISSIDHHLQGFWPTTEVFQLDPGVEKEGDRPGYIVDKKSR